MNQNVTREMLVMRKVYEAGCQYGKVVCHGNGT